MTNNNLFTRKRILLLLFLFSFVLSFSQSEIQLVIPEGIKSSLISIEKNKSQSQLIFNENNSNKIIVWDLIQNRQKYNLRLSSPIRSMVYHPSEKYIYVATTETIYIIDSENGTILNQKNGTNYINKNFSPFLDDQFVYIKDNQLFLSDIFSENERKIEISQTDFYLNNACFDLENKLLFVFDYNLTINLFKSDLSYLGKLLLNDFNTDIYTVNDYLITFNNIGTKITFDGFDLKSLKLKNKIEINKSNGFESFHDKSKQYIGHYQNRVLSYLDNKIIIKDIITGKTIHSILLKINEVEDIEISEDKSSLLVYGLKPNTFDERELFIYDLNTFSLKEFENQVENKNNWSNSIFFDDENFFVYRFTEDRILKNSIQSGELVSDFNIPNNQKISSYSFPPTVINNRYYILVVEDEDYNKSIICVDDNKLLWTHSLKNSFTQIKIDNQKRFITIVDEGYPDNFYTVLDFPTGKQIFTKKSENKIRILPLTKDKIITTSMFQGGDWKNPINEFHISEFSASENKKTFHKIPLTESGWNDDLYVNDTFLYVKFTNYLMIFNKDDLSKPINSINIPLQDFRIINVFDDKFMYLNNIGNEKSFKVIDLIDEKPVFENNLQFVAENTTLHQILLKDNENKLHIFHTKTQEFIATEVNLSETREIKIFHNKWLVYKKDKNECIYDLENKKNKHFVNNTFEIKSLSIDGNLYFDFGKLKFAKNDSEFVSLANSESIPSSISDLSFDSNTNEVMYFDENRLLCFLDVSKNKIKSFQPFLSPSYDVKYQKLSPNLFLVSDDLGSLNREYKILDINSGKITNLSTNSFEITDFNVNKESLFVTGNNKLKIFNLNNAEQIFETKVFSHKQLSESLVIYDDSKKIGLYNIKSNKVLWEVEIPRKDYKSYFVDILSNTIFVINEDIIYALNIRNGNIITSHSLQNKVTTFYSKPAFIEFKKIFINIGNDFEAKYQVLEYRDNKFMESDSENSRKIDLTTLKQQFQIEENDNFSLNENILATYKYPTNTFSVFDITTEKKLFEQQLKISNLGLSWDVLETDKKIFLYNESGNVMFVDYDKNSSSEYKIDGNNFKIYNQLLYVSDYGKKIDVYEFGNTEKLNKLYSLVPTSDEEYLFYTNSGNYLSTKEAAKDIQFRLGNNLYTFEEFDLVYNRPDLVLKSMKSTNNELIKMYENAYQKRVKRQNYVVTSSIENTPSSEIVNQNIVSETEQNSFYIEIKADAKTEKLSKIIIKVNDNLYKEIPNSSKVATIKEEIQLNKGQNNIEIYAINNKNEKGISQKLEIIYHQEVKTPKVYFFGIGVSDYKNDKFDLKYASKDIQDMSKSLSDRYPNIDMNIILDKDVTIENLKKIKQKLAETQIDDIVIISFCGHGVLDKDYNWFFATHDLDFDNPQKRGFSYDDLTELTNNIKSRQKLITIDACHSGEVDIEDIQTENKDINHQKEENSEGKVTATKRGAIATKLTKDGGKTSFELMKQMFSDLESSNGTIVISASGGMEYAYEGGNYNNGVFTYSILNLLDNSVWNTLKISELQKTVMENVFHLTDGKQQPNVRTGTLNYDWVVW